MKTRYKHSQIGYLFILIVTLFNVYLLVWGGYHGASFLLIFSLSVLFIALFSTLTIEVHDHLLKVRFGIGIIRKTIDLNALSEFEITRTKWYYSWGIRFTPRGIMYNIFGLDAVFIKLTNGKSYLIGSDDPENLYQAIKDSLKQ